MVNHKSKFLFEHIFPTPLLTARWDNVTNLNNQLRMLILEEMRVKSGYRRNNIGGWSSHISLFEQDIPAINEFKQMVREAIQKMLDPNQDSCTDNQIEGWEIQAWANVSRENYLHQSHDHLTVKKSASWSGIYYLDPGSIDESMTAKGLTAFENRNFSSYGLIVNGTPHRVNQAGVPPPREEKIVPEAGKMVIFPASLWHRVESYKGKEKRITIAFNLRHKDFSTYVFSKEGYGKFNFWMWVNFRGVMNVGVFFKNFLRSLGKSFFR